MEPQKTEQQLTKQLQFFAKKFNIPNKRLKPFETVQKSIVEMSLNVEIRENGNRFDKVGQSMGWYGNNNQTNEAGIESSNGQKPWHDRQIRGQFDEID